MDCCWAKNNATLTGSTEDNLQMTPARALPQQGLYAITDCRNLTTTQLLHKTEQILQAGAAMLQYRNKDADAAVKLSQAGSLQKLCAQYGIPFIINDEPGLARMLEADGVHLGREDMTCKEARKMLGPKSIIGISCYNEIERAKTAAAEGASYIALGAFFRTRTKPDAIRVEPELISRTKRIVRRPVVAIGGITPDNGTALLEAGADFLAVCSGLYLAADTCNVAQNYMALFNHL
jgi:thiamine-phosphate pyrophosphorylase